MSRHEIIQEAIQILNRLYPQYKNKKLTPKQAEQQMIRNQQQREERAIKKHNDLFFLP